MNNKLKTGTATAEQNANAKTDQDQITEPVDETSNEVVEDAKSESSVIPSESEESQDSKSTDSSPASPDQNDKTDVSEDEAVVDESAQQPQSTPKVMSDSSKQNPNAKWYVVHTYSGHENKVAATLKQRIESEHLEKKILDILVPTQDKIEIKGGKKTEVKEKIFPGYILVNMDLDDTSWLAVRTTQGVTSFVGIGNKPTPISDGEVATIIKFTQEAAPTFKQVFASDDTVRIVEGPFAEFIGKIDSVDEEKGKVRVLVSIFGRETPVELDFLQVTKI